MARILIGNIKGPKGDTGPQGEQGPVGPQGPQGPLPPLVNNALSTEAGVAALDAVMGKTLQDQITQVNSDLGAYYRLSGGTKIPAGSDLQNYKTPGNYYCGSNSDVLTLLNCPAQFAFNLKVEYGSGTGYPTQTLTEYFTKTKYVNSFIAEQNTWSGWISYLTNADLDGHIAFLSSGETALEAGSGNTRYRLQIDTVGNVLIFKSTDGGSTWPTSKVIASM